MALQGLQSNSPRPLPLRWPLKGQNKPPINGPLWQADRFWAKDHRGPKDSEELTASPGSAHRVRQRPGPGGDHHQRELQRRWARCGGWEGPEGLESRVPCPLTLQGRAKQTLVTKHLPLNFPWIVFLPFQVPDLSSLLHNSELHRSHFCLPAFGPHICMGSHAFLI